jgi:hypothetical protein
MKASPIVPAASAFSVSGSIPSDLRAGSRRANQSPLPEGGSWIDNPIGSYGGCARFNLADPGHRTVSQERPDDRSP